MDPHTASNKRLDNCVRVEVTSDAMAAKIKVMGHFRKLVANGFGQWQTLDDGTIRLQLVTGETYLLELTTITRIA